VNLPFSESESEYNEAYDYLLESDDISDELKKYIKDRHKIRCKWAKYSVKKTFTAGSCSSSRVEAKHRIYKTFLNGNSRLSKIFKLFTILEEQKISEIDQAIQKKTKKENIESDKHELIKKTKELYSQYAVYRMEEVLIDSIHYSVVKKNNYW